MPKHGEKQMQQPLEAPTKPAETKPIEDVIAPESPDHIKAAMEQIKAAAQTPDTSDLTKLKEAANTSFDADELGGKDNEVIQGEVVEEKPLFEWDTFDKPYLSLAQKVAKILNEAYPEATDAWKLHFYREATGFQTIAQGEAEAGSTTILTSLEEAIKETPNTPVLENASVSNEKADLPNEGVIAPDNTGSSNPIPESPANPMGLSVVPKTEIVIAPKSVGFRMPSPDEFNYMQSLAKSVAQSGFYKDINTYDKALVIMMKGYALQVDPMTALDGIYIISGRPYVGAKLMKALLENTGQCQRFDIIGDDTQCTVTIQRKGRPEPNIFKFTMEDARKGKLTGKDNWTNSPKKMLKWRAIKEAVETEFAELAFGLGMGGVDEDEEAA